MPNTLKMGFKLLLITVIATFALALTQMITEEPIKVRAEKASNEARTAVLSSADEFIELEVDEEAYPNVIRAFKGLADGNLEGYVFQVSNRGYGGNLEVLVGFNNEGTLSGLRVISHKETPGLGAKVQDSHYCEQYKGLPVDEEISSNEINVISGATVSSNAVTSAVNHAIDFYQAELKGGSDS
ncbi:MAG: RnfABCDGE type electron transport complex subunit G [Caldicoprobacterales bacterium]|jgi:electron transport complex protein RnfG